MRKNHTAQGKRYRLILADDITHNQLAGIRFSKFSGIITLVSLVIVFVAFIYSIIAFTPVRTTIPGYPDVFSRNKAIENSIKIDSLENEIVRWELYTQNLRRVLTGEKSISLDSIVMTHGTKYLTDISEEEMHSQDSILREKVKN